uniref:Peroxiredoxin-like 2A n=1 Tax=Plectus sambesii TaxID=2011161 RepID=A0A914WST4_9BILA
MLGMFGWSAAAAVTGVAIYANLPTRMTLGAILPTLSYLADAPLKKMDNEQSVLTATPIKASELWKGQPTLVMAVRRPGCLLCREEAAALSALKPELDKAGIRLCGVVHETRGVDKFKPYFQGDLYYDVERRFYGPNERWMPVWMGFLRLGTYLNVYRAKQKGFEGNLKGEGRLLGGVYLINNDKIVWEHLESEWGDTTTADEVREAVRKLQ